MDAHQGTSHRAVVTAVATLLIIAYATIGGALTLGFSQEFFNATQSSSDLPIESIRISGYDATDTTSLQVHNGLYTNDNSAGASDGFILENERIGIYLQNNSVEKIAISELRFAGTVYEFSGDANKLESFGSNTTPEDGEYVILSKVPDVLVNSATPELQPGQHATVILGVDEPFKLGRTAQIKFTTTNGYVILGNIVTGVHQVQNSNFVTAVINNPGEQEPPQEPPQEQPQCNPVTIDFETNANGDPLSAGSIISNQWQANNIHISAINNHDSHPNEAIIFNSNNPTGSDGDLGSPWTTGNVGADTDLGNILIIAEDSVDADGDGLVDDPDDEANGGVIFLNSNYSHCSFGFDLIDIEQSEGSSGYLLINFEGSGSIKKHFNDFSDVSFGDNSFNRITISAGEIGQTFNSVEIHLEGSGAIDNISLG